MIVFVTTFVKLQKWQQWQFFFFLPFGSQLSLYGEEQSRYSSLFVFYKWHIVLEQHEQIYIFERIRMFIYLL